METTWVNYKESKLDSQNNTSRIQSTPRSSCFTEQLPKQKKRRTILIRQENEGQKVVY